MLKSLGNANKVEFYSDKVVYRGTSKYMAITIADGTLTVSDSTNDYIAVVKVFSKNKNLLKKIRLLSVN